MTETATLTFRDEAKQVPFTLSQGNEVEARAKVGEFLATVDMDFVLRYLAQQIIDDAYSQDDEEIFDRYAELYAQFEIGMINFDRDDLVLFVSAEGMEITVQLSYAGQIEDWQLDIYE